VLTDALKGDGDEVMLDIYETVQDELRVKNKQLQKETKKVLIYKVWIFCDCSNTRHMCGNSVLSS